MSRVGDVRCVTCSLVDNMRAGAELNRLSAPYNTTGTLDTIIAVNSRAMQHAATAAGASTARRRLTQDHSTDALPVSGFPHLQRDDPDRGTTYGWCDDVLLFKLCSLSWSSLELHE